MNYIPIGCMSSRHQPATEILKGHTFTGLLEAFRIIVSTYLSHLDNAAWPTILKKKFGLDGYEPSTLVTIGKEYKVTRERIRQLIFLMTHQIKKLMEGKELDKPRIFCNTKEFFSFFQHAILEHKILTQSKINSIFNIMPSTSTEHYIDLLMHVYDYEVITYKGIRIYYKDSIFKNVFEKIRRFVKFMTRQASFISGRDIKKALAIEIEDLEFYLSFIPEIEEKEGAYRVPLKNLYSHALCIQRILHEVQHPMYIKDLLEELVKRGRIISVTEYGASSLRSKSREVIPIGRTGQWALREWNLETATMPHLLERAFLKAKKPLTVEELIIFLNKALEKNGSNINSQSSIRSTLCVYKDKFVQYRDDTYGLKRWNLHLPKKHLRKANYFHKLKRDIILEKVIEMLKKRKKILLNDIVRGLTKQGFKRVVIYSAINRSNHLFIKDKRRGCFGRFISLNPLRLELQSYPERP